MRTLTEIALMVERVDRVELVAWVERGWVAPAGRRGPEPLFSDLDVARVCLLCDLVHDLAVEEETIPLVLALLDQVYDLRRQLNALTAAIRQQPDDVRRAVLALLEPRSEPPAGGAG
jgi:chaperone modulatory protein CbpM